MESAAAIRKWKKLACKWKQTFLLDNSKAALGSWLDEQEEPWGIGCKACCSAGCAGKFSQYMVNTEAGLQKQNLLKHAQSKSHVDAVARYLSAAVSASAGSTPSALEPAVAPDAAPDVKVFQDFLNQAKKGAALDGRKGAQLAFCLAEAMKSLDQKQLSRASEIALFRDERKGRILIRFRAVSAELDVHCGVLGQERDAGTGGQCLTTATENVLKRSCSRWVGSGSDKQRPFVKTKLLKHVCEHITTLTVDSAGDELVSAEIMRTALTPEQKDEGVKTEAGFVRKRRKAAASAASDCAALTVDSLGDAGDNLADSAFWTAKHDRELAFQQQKTQSRLVHAYSENSLLPEEAQQDVRNAHLICVDKFKDNEIKRQRQRDLASMALGVTRQQFFDTIAGSFVYLAVPVTYAIEEACRKLRLQICTKATDADVILCDAPGRMTTDCRLRLVSALRGCYEMSPGLLHGAHGCALKMTNAACLQRAILISSGSQQCSPKFWRFLQSCLPAVNSWVLRTIDGLDQLLEAQSGYKSGVAFVIISEAEAKQHQSELEKAKNVFTLDSFLERIRRVDSKKSVTGLFK
eukprot:Skav234542  [mRNA]  locus=scaffold2556:223344:226376:+ [translate_table: standard]